MKSRTFAVLFLAFLSLDAAGLHAERLHLSNGLEVQGYLVGHDQTGYLVRIGAFTKHVPDAQVKSIVDDAAAPPAPSSAAGAPRASSAGPSADASVLQGLLGGGGGGGIDLSHLLGSMGAQGGASGAAGGLDLSQLLGGLNAGGGGSLGGSIGALAERMKDPAFQQQFLGKLEELNAKGPNPGAATPYIGMLKGLFHQLNQTQSPDARRR